MKEIAHIETDFVEKFGVPRQSGLIEEVKGKIIFEPEFRTYDAFKGLEEYSHIWLSLIVLLVLGIMHFGIANL